MDDLKLYCLNKRQLDTLINSVRAYSEDIRMAFVILKCVDLNMKWRKYDE